MMIGALCFIGGFFLGGFTLAVMLVARRNGEGRPGRC